MRPHGRPSPRCAASPENRIVEMRGRDGRSAVAIIAQAAFVLLAVAVGARVVYGLLAPLLPSLLAIGFVVGLAYWLLLRR